MKRGWILQHLLVSNLNTLSTDKSTYPFSGAPVAYSRQGQVVWGRYQHIQQMLSP